MARAQVKEPQKSPFTRLWRMASSVRTGIVLLILVVVAAAAGTLILQRPITDPEQLHKVYSASTLRWLDAVGLTDVFHSLWFVVLLCLLAINLVCASIERFPTVWRFFSRPYVKPDPHFLSALPLHQEIPLRSEERGLEAAEHALRRLGFSPRRIGSGTSFSLFAERNRFSRLGAYVVHVSLLLVLAGGIVDALWGYRGYLSLGMDEQSNQIDLRNGASKMLPFTIRCEGAGQENYANGSPKRWWSRLAVVENGREVLREEIEVNKPLTYRGVRFFQSGYGSTGEVSSLSLVAIAKNDATQRKEFTLRQREGVSLDEKTQVSLAAFVPDMVIVGDHIETRSDQPNNPAIQLAVTTPAGVTKVWLFPKFPSLDHPGDSPYRFEFRDVAMGYFTGLQVSYEPGQWAVWGGALLMGVGLIVAFYFIHLRIWVTPVSDDRGRTSLWVGASASKNREEFEEKFRELIRAIEEEILSKATAPVREEATVAGA